MSDFLRNLRSSHKKDKSNPRRNLDGHYYPKEDRRLSHDRRTNFSNNSASVSTIFEEVLPRIAENTSDIALQLEKFFAQNEKLIEAKINNLNSMTTFFDNLNKIFTEDSFAPPQTKTAKTTASYAIGTHYTKEEIIDIIQTMRESGATFAVVAKYLRDKGIPTFSGRGEWHAQTIHRLCK